MSNLLSHFFKDFSSGHMFLILITASWFFYSCIYNSLLTSPQIDFSLQTLVVIIIKRIEFSILHNLVIISSCYYYYYFLNRQQIYHPELLFNRFL